MTILKLSKPPAHIALVDETGLMTPVWIRFMESLFVRLGGAETPDVASMASEVDVLQASMAVAIVDIDNLESSEMVFAPAQPANDSFAAEMIFAPVDWSPIGTLPVTKGGTGKNGFVQGDLIHASGTATISGLADIATGNALLSGGVGIAPAWGKVDLGTTASGTLAAAQFPALTGDVTTAAGSLATTIGSSFYSTGTFTPTVRGATTAGSATYSIQSGSYTKIGNRLLFNMRVAWSSATGTGDLQISGLPFASNGGSTYCGFTVYGLAVASQASYYALLPPGASVISIYSSAVGGGPATVPLPASGDLFMSGQYIL